MLITYPSCLTCPRMAKRQIRHHYLCSWSALTTRRPLLIKRVNSSVKDRVTTFPWCLIYLIQVKAIKELYSHYGLVVQRPLVVRALQGDLDIPEIQVAVLCLISLLWDWELLSQQTVLLLKKKDSYQRSFSPRKPTRSWFYTPTERNGLPL